MKKNTKTLKSKKNKTLKNTKNICNNFCKNDYLIQLDKKIKESSKKFNIPYQPPTKKDKQLGFKACKKTFCNKKCKGYDFFGDLEKQKNFNKNIKNGFQTSYSNNKIEMFKKKGALSGCVDVDIFD
jgi:hypothetical protein